MDTPWAVSHLPSGDTFLPPSLLVSSYLAIKTQLIANLFLVPLLTPHPLLPYSSASLWSFFIEFDFHCIRLHVDLAVSIGLWVFLKQGLCLIHLCIRAYWVVDISKFFLSIHSTCICSISAIYWAYSVWCLDTKMNRVQSLVSIWSQCYERRRKMGKFNNVW